MRWILNIIGILVLIFLQVYFFNQFLFMGYLNPYIYLYPVLGVFMRLPRLGQLLAAFALGASIDLLEGSGGVHTAATVFLAFLSPLIFQIFNSGREENSEESGVKTLSIERSLGFLFLGIFIHHLALFSLESFSPDTWLVVLKRTVYSSLFSFAFVLLYQLWNTRR